MVLVCNDPAFVFLKTRKTAGTSIEMALEPCCAPPGHQVVERTEPVVSDRGIVGARLVPVRKSRLPRFARKLALPEWHSHMTAKDARRRLGARRFAAATKISAVREPFARVVSLFHWQMKSRNIPVADPHDAFARWIRTDWPTDLDVVAIDGRVVVDRFIRFEHLAEDVSDLAGDLGLSLDFSTLPHAKDNARSRSAPVATYYSEDIADIVRDRMAWAFAAGGYSAGLPHPPTHTDQDPRKPAAPGDEHIHGPNPHEVTP